MASEAKSVEELLNHAGKFLHASRHPPKRRGQQIWRVTPLCAGCKLKSLTVHYPIPIVNNTYLTQFLLTRLFLNIYRLFALQKEWPS
jgi:hypothetical protein